MILIGSGTFAKVYFDEEEQLVVRRSAIDCRVWREIPRHENLLRLVKLTQTVNRDFLYYTEHYPNGDLFTFLAGQTTNPTPLYCLNMIRRIARGVKALHDSHFAHRDIKLENILLGKQFEPVLCDFDFLIRVDPNSTRRLHKRCGSVPYCAPEVLMAVEHDPRQSDCWSLGVVLYGIYFSRLPFDPPNIEDGRKTDPHKREREIVNRICGNQYDLPSNAKSYLESLLFKAIRGLLEPDPELRLPVDGLLHLLKDVPECTLVPHAGYSMEPAEELVYIHGNKSDPTLIEIPSDPHGYTLIK